MPREDVDNGGCKTITTWPLTTARHRRKATKPRFPSRPPKEKEGKGLVDVHISFSFFSFAVSAFRLTLISTFSKGKSCTRDTRKEGPSRDDGG